MGRLIDLTGQKFGRLTVIKRDYSDPRNKKKKQAFWLCKCECGKEKVIVGESLRNGITKSCGCLGIENRTNATKLGYGISSLRHSITNYKRHAKRRLLKWNLTEEQFKEITQQDCFYCGAKPNNKSHNKRSNGDYVYNGIDRVDNNKGYTMENVVPCCKDCNYAKRDLTVNVFKDWIERVHNNMFLKEVT